MSFIQDIDQLLKPHTFDWAEDVEGDISEAVDVISVATTSDHEKAFYPLEDEMTGRFYQAFDNDVQESIPVPITPLIIDGSRSRHNPPKVDPSQKILEIACVESEVQSEYAYRSSYEETYGSQVVHHFNWFGNPVGEHSSTPPEISLLFLLTNPKTPRSHDALRIESILTRATVYIDPVVIYLQGGIAELYQNASNLIRFAVGRTFKFYSPHGWWVNDMQEREEQTQTDEGRVSVYLDPQIASGNGFVELNSIRSRKAWCETRRWLYDAAAKRELHNLRAKRKYRGHRPSPLRQSIIAHDLDRIGDSLHSHTTKRPGSLVVPDGSRALLFWEPEENTMTEKSESELSPVRKDQEDTWNASCAGRDGMHANFTDSLLDSPPELVLEDEKAEAESDSDSSSIENLVSFFEGDQSTLSPLKPGFSTYKVDIPANTRQSNKESTAQAGMWGNEVSMVENDSLEYVFFGAISS